MYDWWLPCSTEATGECPCSQKVLVDGAAVREGLFQLSQGLPHTFDHTNPRAHPRPT